MFIYLDEKGKKELKELLDNIKEYCEVENRNIMYLGQIFIQNLGTKSESLKILFHYFYKLDEAIHDIPVPDERSRNTVSDLETYITRYESYLFENSEEAESVVIGTLKNIG